MGIDDNQRTTLRISRASALDTVRVLAAPLAATIAIGVIVRRPRMVRLAARFDTDRRGVRQLQRLRNRYQVDVLRLRLPFRPMALALSESAVQHVLEGAPTPFTPANKEKVAALRRFQPGGVLISSPEERPARREFNTTVLDTGRPVHSAADHLMATIGEEARGIADAAALPALLTWDAFAAGWWRTVRRLVLGDSARDDTNITDLLKRLRQDGNWGPFQRERPAVRGEFLRRVELYLSRAEPGSLAALAARTAAGPGVDPVQQVPQWLFAFDAAGIAVYRSLALLASYPDADRRADAEAAGRDLSVPQDLPYLRACIHEAIRLWPTTPAILRDYSPGPQRTRLGTGSEPELAGGEMVLIYAPYFHRDDQRLDYAHRFAPDIWLDGRAEQSWSLLPFSAGPAECPGRNLVLYTTSTMLAALRANHRYRPGHGTPLGPGRDLPGTFDHIGLHFRVRSRTAVAYPLGRV